MGEYKVLKRCEYSNNQNDYLVVKEYLFALKNEKKELLLKLMNNYSENLHSFKLKVSQYNKKGSVIETSFFECKNFSCVPKQSFVPNGSIILNKECEDILIEVLNAGYDKFRYDINKVNQNKNIIREEEQENDTFEEDKINNNVIRKDFFVKKRSIRLPKSFYILSSIIIIIASILCGFVVDRYKRENYKFDINDFTYEIVDGGKEDYEFSEDSEIILTSYNGIGVNITIPEKILNHKIVGIGDSAFANNKFIKKVNLPNNENFTIGKESFANCGKLESVSFGGTVSVGEKAFYLCNKLKDVKLEKVDYIGNMAFSESGITSVIISDNGNILELGIDVFGFCPSLNSVIIEKGVFWNDENVSFLTKNTAVKTLKLVNNYNREDYTSYKVNDFFGGNSELYLTELEFEKLASIPDNFALNLESLLSLKIGDVIDKKVGSYAFMNCKNLKEIEYDFKDFTYVGDFGFFNTGIKEFDFSKVTYLGESAFAFSDIQKVNLLDENFIGLTNSCFDNCEFLNEVTIEAPIYSIPINCFQNTQITSLVLDEKSVLTEIGQYAFNNCSQLVSFDSINTCQTIYNNAFEGCTSLQGVNFGNQLKTIKGFAFKDCSSLIEVNLDEAINLEHIGLYAFEGCTSLESFDFTKLSSLATLAKGVFKNCSNLKEIDMSLTNISEISEELFLNCSLIEKVTLYNNVEKINESAFENCSSLMNIELPNTITLIENFAFEGCTSLENIVIPTTVTYLGQNILKGCNSLINVDLPYLGSESNSVTDFDYIFSSDYLGNIEELKIQKASNIKEYCFTNVKGVKKIIIEEDIDFVSDNAFSHSSFEEIEIKGKISRVGSRILSDCNALKKLTIPYFTKSMCTNFYTIEALPSLETLILTNQEIIETQHFSFMKSLKNIEFLNDTLKQIRSEGFYGLENLEEIVIPDSVEQMDYRMFALCPSLKKVTLPFIGYNISSPLQFNNYFDYWNSDSIISVEEVIVTKANSLNMNCFDNMSSIKKVTLPDSLTYISYGTFRNCYSLEEVIIPNTVTYIDTDAFYNCISLKNLVLPSSLTSLGYNSFKNCFSLHSIINLSSINLKNSYEFGLSEYLLEELTSLEQESSIVYHDIDGYQFIESEDDLIMVNYPKEEKNLTLPTSVTVNETIYDSYSIKGGLFYNSNVEEISIPDFITNIYPLTFRDCKKLSRINFSEDSLLENIGESAFENNKNLSNFNNLFESLTSIGPRAFAGCENLLSVTLPTLLNYIDYNAFENCTKLYEIYNLSNLNIEIGSYDHGYVAYNALVIHDDSNKQALESYIDNNFEYAYSDDECFIISYLGNATEVVLPEKIIIEDKEFTSYDIGPKAFYQKSFESLHISKAVKKIHTAAFWNCSSLKTVTSDDESQLVEIGRDAFRECYSLKSFEMPNSVKKIGQYSFYYNNELSEIELPESLEFLGSYAFGYCYKLESVKIHENVKTIEFDCFYECTNLVEVYNLSSLNIEIGSSDNGYCGYYALVIHKSLEEAPLIKYEQDGLKYILLDGIGYITGYDNYNTPYDLKIPEELIVDGQVFDKFIINKDAFRYYYGDQEIIIPSSVIEINNNAFSSVSSIKKVIFLEGSPIEVLPENCFSYCENLRYIKLPESLKTIKYGCFYSTGLIEITLPSTLETIEDNAFFECRKMIRITNLSKLNIDLGSSQNGGIAVYATSISNTETEPLEILETENALLAKHLDNWILVNYNETYYSPFELPSEIVHGEIVIEEYALGNYFTYSYTSNHIIIVPTSVNKIYKHAFSRFYNNYKIYYKGDKTEWENITESNFSNVYFYSDCIHEENQWKYVNFQPVVGFVSISWSEEVSATCSTQGYKKGTCSVCNEIVEITYPSLNHQYEDGKCSICNKQATKVGEVLFTTLFTNDKDHPFGCNTSGQLMSSNKEDNSSSTLTFKMKNDGVIAFTYRISSELNCDHMIIRINEEEKEKISGINVTGNLIYYLKKNDILTITYSKDVSVSEGDDYIYIYNFLILENGG